jgi:hypothetical protein
MSAAPESSFRVVITLVHGTWASEQADWTGESSELCRILRDTLTLPDPDLPPIEHIAFRRFRWSGKNTNRARLDAATSFGAQLRQQANTDPQAAQFIIGHSHGGNVALYAVGALAAQCRVAGVACLNTPFIGVLRRNVGQFISNLGQMIGLFIFIYVPHILFLMLPFDLGPRRGLVWNALAASTILIFWFLIGTQDLAETLIPIIKRRAEDLVSIISLPINRQVPVLSIWTAGDEVISGLTFLESLANLPFMLLTTIALHVLFLCICLGILIGWLPAWVPGPGWQSDVIRSFIVESPPAAYAIFFSGLLVFQLFAAWRMDLRRDERLGFWNFAALVLFSMLVVVLGLTHVGYVLGFVPEYIHDLIFQPLPPPPNPELIILTGYLFQLASSALAMLIVVLAGLVYIALLMNVCLRVLPSGIGVDQLWDSTFVRLTFTFVPLYAERVRFIELESRWGLLKHSEVYRDKNVIGAIAIWIRQSMANADSTVEMTSKVDRLDSWMNGIRAGPR